MSSRASIISSGVWNDHEYTVVKDPKSSWEAAAGDALSLGLGYLATITSVDEQNFIETLLSGLCGEYWLGGRQPDDEQVANANWSWVTGEPWSYTNWHTATYHEPNDYYGAGSEQRLATWHRYSWQWNDESHLGNITGYVAEAATPIPEPPIPLMLIVGGGFLVVSVKRKRFWHKTPH